MHATDILRSSTNWREALVTLPLPPTMFLWLRKPFRGCKRMVFPAEWNCSTACPCAASLALAKRLNVPVRLYIPYGQEMLRYAVSKVLRHPHIGWQLAKDFVHSIRRPGPALAGVFGSPRFPCLRGSAAKSLLHFDPAGYNSSQLKQKHAGRQRWESGSRLVGIGFESPTQSSALPVKYPKEVLCPNPIRTRLSSNNSSKTTVAPKTPILWKTSLKPRCVSPTTRPTASMSKASSLRH